MLEECAEDRKSTAELLNHPIELDEEVESQIYYSFVLYATRFSQSIPTPPPQPKYRTY
jgi:hypothetical protein